MAIVSDTFGGLRLSGEDASKFERQVRFGRTAPAARLSAQRGIASAQLLIANGHVKVDSKKR